MGVVLECLDGGRGILEGKGIGWDKNCRYQWVHSDVDISDINFDCKNVRSSFPHPNMVSIIHSLPRRIALDLHIRQLHGN